MNNMITLDLLEIIRETETDDLTTVMQKIVCTYTEQLVPGSRSWGTPSSWPWPASSGR